MALLSIGEVSRETGVPATTLRYYEQIGIVVPATREGGRRRYDSAAVTRLQVVAACKAAGFTLDEIHVLLADDAPGRPASRALAEAKLADIDERIAELGRARAILEWGMQCTCPSIDTCTCGIHGPGNPVPAP